MHVKFLIILYFLSEINFEQLSILPSFHCITIKFSVKFAFFSLLDKIFVRSDCWMKKNEISL